MFHDKEICIFCNSLIIKRIKNISFLLFKRAYFAMQKSLF
ncbi:hypothetical protein HMPREF0653_01307 [Prevotella disiens JCM 6334 = ATCC 29426]|uniref:Uncharacterized protein n=1 Tax=Prevotella disiens JCM 6334 = ATCC 29426 TaxID=1235811 RepID=A0ABN0NS79_9BACT|nr:hypothetical protein HMPREF0653_01307 [Prevotella disiens JCM 6334 = ATCC 29426]